MDVKCPRCQVSFEGGEFPASGTKRLSCPICRTYFEVSFSATILTPDQPEKAKSVEEPVRVAPIISAKSDQQDDEVRQREEDERRQREEDERRQREEDERRQREEDERRQREEDERRQREEDERRQREEDERRQREEDEHRQREEDERRQREEDERRQREEDERRKRKETEERKRREKEERERKAADERRHKQEAERQRQKEQERKRQQEARQRKDKKEDKSAAAKASRKSSDRHQGLVEEQDHDAVTGFFDSKPTLKDYHKEFEPLDFTDLDSKEDHSRRHMYYIGVFLALFVVVGGSLAWFISDNISKRREAERTVFLYEAGITEEETEITLKDDLGMPAIEKPKSFDELEQEPGITGMAEEPAEEPAIEPPAEEAPAAEAIEVAQAAAEPPAEEAPAPEAVEAAQVAEAQAQALAQEEARRQAEEEAKRKQQEEARLAAEADARRQAEETARREEESRRQAALAQQQAEERRQAEEAKRQEEVRRKEAERKRKEAEAEKRRREQAQAAAATPAPTPAPAATPAPKAQSKPALSPAQRRQNALDHYRSGNQMITARNFNGAITEYRQALEFNPAFAQAHRGLGIAYASLGRSQDAVREYRLYLKMAPNAPDANQVRQILGE